MSIFGPYVSWDPREPLPEELQSEAIRMTSNPYYHPVSFKRFFKRKKDNSNTGLSTGYKTPTDREAQTPTPALTTREESCNVMAPWSIEINASVVEDTVCVKTKQTFWNNSTLPIPKGAYTFPLPYGCVVTAFNYQIGSRKMQGVIKPKEQAKLEFSQHVKAGRLAALLEQETTEIFNTTLGNIPPDTRIKLELSYLTLLKQHHHANFKSGNLSFTIPTIIASRYGSPPLSLDMATSNVKQGLSLSIEVSDPQAMLTPKSRTHKIKVTKKDSEIARSWRDLAGEASDSGRGRTILVQLEQGSMFLDADFVLDIEVEDTEKEVQPRALIETHESKPNHKALMITLPPRLMTRMNEPEPGEREILFLADQSNSMSDKLTSLRSAMEFFLKGIPVGMFFNIGCFGSNFTKWSEETVRYSEESLESAFSYITGSFHANMGGTEILPAVQSLLTLRNRHRWADIIILTDGEVWRLDSLLETIRDARDASRGGIRFFCLGIGDNVSHELVEGIARSGGGYAEVIPAAAQNGWEDRLISMQAAALMDSHVFQTTIKVEFTSGESLDYLEARRSPVDLRTLSPFVQSRIYLFIDSITQGKDIKSIVLVMTLPDGTQRRHTVPAEDAGSRDGTIHKFAAYSMLEEFERVHSFSAETAENFACEWGLSSKWTSIVVAEQNPSPNQNDDQVIQIAPVSSMRHTVSPTEHIAYGQAIPQSTSSTKGIPYIYRMTGSSKAHTVSRFAKVDVDGYVHTRGINSSRKQRYKPQPPYAHPYAPLYSSDPKPFLKALVTSQTFNGSFDFSSSGKATDILGTGIVLVVKRLATKSVTEPLLYTGAIIIILERDYGEFKDLWQMMMLKARTFISEASKHLSDFSMQRLRELLVGLRVPLKTKYLSIESSQLNDAENSSEEEFEHGSGPRSEEHRDVVTHAPL